MVKARSAALSAEATTPAVISQGSGRAQATAQSEVQWLGLETLNWGAGSLVTVAEEASGGRAGLRARLRWELRARLGGGECEVTI